jgi:hypothetical protein
MVGNEALLQKWGARRLTPDEFRTTFREEWASISEHFFKCEAYQYYTQPGDPSFEALVEGKLYKAARLISEQLVANQSMYDDARSRGIHLIRVRAVTHPLSYYLHYEFMSYLTSQRLGEEIRIADLDAVREVEIGDFLLFDDRVALVHDYVPPKNEQDGGWLVNDPIGLDYLRRAREILIERSVILDDFVIPDQSLHYDQKQHHDFC